MKIVMFGLSITSSRVNSHAGIYRPLVKELDRRGHEVLFLERDVPWHASHRNFPLPSSKNTQLYLSLEELRDRFHRDVREADLVMVGSYVPDGNAISQWVTEEAGGLTAFYDLDAPVTAATLERGDCKYVSAAALARFDFYLSTTGGPLLSFFERRFGVPRALPLHGSIDAESCRADEVEPRWDLGYLGPYSSCRQSALSALMLDAARSSPQMRMIVGGCQYPADIQWPANVERVAEPEDRLRFFLSQRFALNVTRADVVAAGYTPATTLFEAAACGTPVISDAWPGLQTFFRIGSEVFVARSAADTLRLLRELKERDLRAVGKRARHRVLAQHTAAHRAAELELYIARHRSFSAA